MQRQPHGSADPEASLESPSDVSMPLPVWLMAAAGMMTLALGAIGGLGGLVTGLTVAVVGAVLWDAAGRRGSAPSRELAAPSVPSRRPRAAGWTDTLAVLRKAAPSLLSIGAIVLFSGYLLLFDLGRNPVGFFSDEAEIGLEASRLLSWSAETSRVPLFYQHFEYRHLGSLPLFATAPVIAVTGRSDEAVRLASALASIAALLAAFAGLRRIDCPYPAVPVIALASAPVFIHVSRVNFGHGPSLLMTSIGVVLWIRAVQRDAASAGLLAGVVLGLGAYGNSAYYIAVPLIVLAIGLSEMFWLRLRWRAYRPTLAMALATTIMLMPVAWKALTDDDFLRRYREKGGSSASITADWTSRLEKIPSYFSVDYLTQSGEASFVTRHSVPGAGLVTPFALAVAITGVVLMVLVRRDRTKRFYTPFVLIALFMPIPDLLSNAPENRPYTFAAFWAILALPYLTGYAIRGAAVMARRHGFQWLGPIVAATVLLVSLASGLQFLNGPYAAYPRVSADYWGWQYGPEPMIRYYEDHAASYDQFLMDGDFNGAYVFLDFYLEDEELRAKAEIGGLGKLDLTKRQLFGIRAENWDRVSASQVPTKRFLEVIATVPYPDGSPAMYLVETKDMYRKSLLDRRS